MELFFLTLARPPPGEQATIARRDFNSFVPRSVCLYSSELCRGQISSSSVCCYSSDWTAKSASIVLTVCIERSGQHVVVVVMKGIMQCGQLHEDHQEGKGKKTRN